MRHLLRVSRPRFWMYLLGPYMVALAATSLRPPVEVWLLGLYLTLPANLLIYGVNDLFDAETDRLNPKKRDYESLLQPAQPVLPAGGDREALGRLGVGGEVRHASGSSDRSTDGMYSAIVGWIGRTSRTVG